MFLLDFTVNLLYNRSMENLREIISKNIIRLRKLNNLTQIELAKKINYSDKAVSRWENGEVLPDVETIKALSDVFNVPMSAILEKQEDSIKPKLTKPSKQEILSQSFIICEIWTIISVIYAYLNISKGYNVWQIFLWGIPATALILLVLNRKRKHNITSFVYGTIFVWSTITCSFLHMLSNPWYIFVLGIPIQGMLIVRYLFNYKQKPLLRAKESKKK